MYGLDTKIKNYIDLKIDKNKSFLKNLTFYNEEYKLISMFDSDMNANLSPDRYFAEVNNRVNTLFKISKELDLVPAFLTITAPSAYHNSSKYYNGSTPRETALYLSELWAKFLRLKIFSNMKINTGHNKIYIRVYEPHKSGVPHLHAMIFVPRIYLKQLKQKFYEHFTKFKIKKIALKFIDRFDKSTKYDGATGAIAYILKYMNKTFKSAKDDIMSNEAYYFAYHGIRRFITSQTLVPLWLYRKIKHNEDTRDLYQLTKDYKDGHVYSSFDKEYIFQRYIKNEKEFISYNKDEYIVNSTIEEKILYQKNHFISDQFKNSNVNYDNCPTSWTKKKKDFIPLFQNGIITHMFRNGEFLKYQKHITQMKDFELYQYYENFDFDSDILTYDIKTKEIFDNSIYVKYLSVKNLMITRGLIIGTVENLSSFDIDKFLLIDEKYYQKNYTWYSAKCIGLL